MIQPRPRIRGLAPALIAMALLQPLATSGQIVSQLDQRSLLQFPNVGLEGPVDPSTYWIVPGDIYALGLWGIADTVLTVGVGPEGRLVVPSVGVVDLRNATLAMGEQLVAEAVREVFPSAKVTMSLVRMGSFRIEVTGLVVRPGGYPATGVQRVRDVLLQAGDILAGGTHREVEILRDRERKRIDLVRWVFEGDPNQNPLVEPGMRIHVPPRGPTFRLRGPIEGAWEPMFPPQRASGPLDRLPQPPQIALEWKRGDTVQGAIRRAGGLTPEALLDIVYLWRHEPGTRRALIPEVVQLSNDSLHAVPVFPGDLVDVPYRGEWVAVTGAVNAPGRYPFLAGWTARDYVNAAGGPSAIGREGGWRRHREGMDTHAVSPTDAVAPGDVITVPQTVSHKASVWLSTASTAVALVLSIIALASR